MASSPTVSSASTSARNRSLEHIPDPPDLSGSWAAFKATAEGCLLEVFWRTNVQPELPKV